MWYDFKKEGIEMLLIVGIISLALCALSLAFSALNRHGYYHLLDGTSELYTRLHRRMTIFFVIGIVLALIGAICLILHYVI